MMQLGAKRLFGLFCVDPPKRDPHFEIHFEIYGLSVCVSGAKKNDDANDGDRVRSKQCQTR